MLPTDPRISAALDAATQRIRATVAAAATRVAESLATAAESSARITERDLLIATGFELRRHGAGVVRSFADTLREKIAQELAPPENSGRKLETANWQTLSLVDDAEMEDRLFADRIGQAISHASDTELREVAAYMGGLLQSGPADLDRNPLRADVLGAAVYSAIQVVSREADARQLLAREFGQALARAMPACYTEIVRDLQARGVRPAVLTARGVEGPGVGGNSGYATVSGIRSQRGDLDSTWNGAVPDSGDSGVSGVSGVSGDDTGRTVRGGSTSAGASTFAASTRPGHAERGVGRSAHADAELMSLLRRLTVAVSRPGEFDPTGPRPRGDNSSRSGPASRLSNFGSSMTGRDSATAPGSWATDEPIDGIRGDGSTRLMAVNLIRAHRAELLQASTGQLDHMVIDVVGSLFDQILSDARVPPQMARQIARLQLPVLRVALRDASFFSSRRHPVRRFVNRMASLACAFDDFTEGPGRLFIERVRELVQEIVDGDFDQIDLYTAQVGELERFIAGQAEREAAQSGAAAALDRKEAELRLQQRHRLQLQGSLAPLPLPDYLRDFLAQVWSQALVLAASRDGADSERAQRFRRAGRELVMSVQPKGSTAMRKRFLMQLPPLMKDLNEGMQLVGWPDTAQKAFFGRLLPAHAESLRAAPLSELDYNMLARQLDGIFSVAAVEPPAERDLRPEPLDDAAAPPCFTPDEARQVGLVEESAVDWSGVVDIDLGMAEPDDSGAAVPQAESASTGSPVLDAALAAPVAEPTRGAGMMDHIQLGFAYQMHLKDAWQKVRLTHVSAGRSFFVFSHGHKHPETISMTSRMLARMCETGRLRAVESAYLMERATQRARRQLAALKTSVA